MELALVGNKPDQLKSVKFRRGAKASNSGVEEMIVMQTSPDITAFGCIISVRVLYVRW